MKNNIYYIIITASLITIGVFGFLFYQKYLRYPTYDTSQLTSVEVNGVKYKTTGSIPTQDANTLLAFNQTVQLASLGEIVNSEFKITTTQYGGVKVELYQPYDQSKQKVIEWLKINGFERIDVNKIQFTEK